MGQGAGDQHFYNEDLSLHARNGGKKEEMSDYGAGIFRTWPLTDRDLEKKVRNEEFQTWMTW